MRDPNQKKFMLNYYVMVVFVFAALLALKLSGYWVAVLSLGAVIVSAPFIQFKKPATRWWILLVLAIIIVFFYPDLSLLKEMEGY